MQPQVAQAQGGKGWEVQCACEGKKLTQLGAEGWEPFAVRETQVCFKRPMP